MKFDEDKIIDEIEKALVILNNDSIRYWTDKIVKSYINYAKLYGYDKNICIERIIMEEDKFVLDCRCGFVGCFISRIDKDVTFSFSNLLNENKITVTNTGTVIENIDELLFNIFD